MPDNSTREFAREQLATQMFQIFLATDELDFERLLFDEEIKLKINRSKRTRKKMLCPFLEVDYNVTRTYEARPQRKIRVSLFAARTLNSTAQSRVTLYRCGQRT